MLRQSAELFDVGPAMHPLPATWRRVMEHADQSTDARRRSAYHGDRNDDTGGGRSPREELPSFSDATRLQRRTMRMTSYPRELPPSHQVEHPIIGSTDSQRSDGGARRTRLAYDDGPTDGPARIGSFAASQPPFRPPQPRSFAHGDAAAHHWADVDHGSSPPHRRVHRPGSPTYPTPGTVTAVTAVNAAQRPISPVAARLPRTSGAAITLKTPPAPQTVYHQRAATRSLFDRPTFHPREIPRAEGPNRTPNVGAGPAELPPSGSWRGAK